MGSYDTGETYTPPRSSVQRYERADITSSSDTSTTPARERVTTFEPGMPILISIGGGLTPSRIVKKLPDEYATKPVTEVFNYLLSDGNLATDEERAIASAVKDRMRQADYRTVINSELNYHNSHLGNQLCDYLKKDQRETEGGTVVFNKADFAVVSHDEGGRKRTLEQMVR